MQITTAKPFLEILRTTKALSTIRDKVQYVTVGNNAYGGPGFYYVLNLWSNYWQDFRPQVDRRIEER